MSKILVASQIREADLQTMKSEPIKSIDLMERAASSCFHWIRSNRFNDQIVRIFCGPGNNGGDGIALARMLSQTGLSVHTYLFGHLDSRSADLSENLKRLKDYPSILLKEVTDISSLPVAGSGELWIDALFGTGITRRLSGIYASAIERINASGADVISIDLPSGLEADKIPSISDPVVFAKDTLSFHAPKLSFFFPESGVYVGRWHILDIGLDRQFITSIESDYWSVDESEVEKRFHVRQRFSHKGTYGHGLLIAGGKGKYGAAVLSAKATLRTGIGLLTVAAPSDGEHILQTSVPEAMYQTSKKEIYFENYDAVGFGPGCGTDSSAHEILFRLLSSHHGPVVIDADGLNILSNERAWMERLPENCILTPHPKEF
ncbi:MAG: NAD(P)H-hydrate epimerase, partial [Bacteroidota bacterium]